MVLQTILFLKMTTMYLYVNSYFMSLYMYLRSENWIFELVHAATVTSSLLIVIYYNFIICPANRCFVNGYIIFDVKLGFFRVFIIHIFNIRIRRSIKYFLWTTKKLLQSSIHLVMGRDIFISQPIIVKYSTRSNRYCLLHSWRNTPCTTIIL